MVVGLDLSWECGKMLYEMSCKMGRLGLLRLWCSWRWDVGIERATVSDPFGLIRWLLINKTCFEITRRGDRLRSGSRVVK